MHQSGYQGAPVIPDISYVRTALFFYSLSSWNYIVFQKTIFPVMLPIAILQLPRRKEDFFFESEREREGERESQSFITDQQGDLFTSQEKPNLAYRLVTWPFYKQGDREKIVRI